MQHDRAERTTEEAIERDYDMCRFRFDRRYVVDPAISKEARQTGEIMEQHPAHAWDEDCKQQRPSPVAQSSKDDDPRAEAQPGKDQSRDRALLFLECHCLRAHRYLHEVQIYEKAQKSIMRSPK